MRQLRRRSSARRERAQRSSRRGRPAAVQDRSAVWRRLAARLWWSFRWKPRDRTCDRPRIEWPQVVRLLADPDRVDWKAELFGCRDEDPAARRSVELGHDEAGHTGALAKHFDLR